MKAVIKLYQYALMAAPNNFTFWQIVANSYEFVQPHSYIFIWYPTDG